MYVWHYVQNVKLIFIDAYQNYFFSYRKVFRSFQMHGEWRPTLIFFYCFIVSDTAYREIKRLFPSEWKRAVSDLSLFINY